MDRIESQARYFKNIPLRDRNIKAVVHLEDDEDKKFWNYQLQTVSSGKYLFLTYSKNNNGNDSRGCEQCLRYKPYLNKRFFICIDSDLRQLKSEDGLSAYNYIAQTYAYSWENHLCEAKHLQERFCSLLAKTEFDFCVFLLNLSKVVYKPLLYLVHYTKSAETNQLWNITKFNTCLPLQPKREELNNNGEIYLDRVSQLYDAALQDLPMPETKENAFVDEENAYLHIQGHQLYKLLLHIGTMLCKGQGVAFKSDVLDKVMPTKGYAEIEGVQKDLKQITS